MSGEPWSSEQEDLGSIQLFPEKLIRFSSNSVRCQRITTELTLTIAVLIGTITGSNNQYVGRKTTFMLRIATSKI